MKLRLARSAVADLDEIWAYLAKKESIEVADVPLKKPQLAEQSLLDLRRPERPISPEAGTVQ
jgi:plasmid stabilization system protein ParE